ncbi:MULTISPECIES: hypothetical protein [Thermoactinomyces]|jgi:hypothetical protein|uniref:hypothetical protein n=1 Tax=Thermoactinomyces TaxID=2023 RepID=UPI000673A064|nr:MULTISPECIES: hypothetical protein [Thermoactinomyces]MBH8602070.1 hypothetical protein [Thermoactinomyces sp. CICC 23799]QBK12254.1 hypothetical protein AB849_000565 [Thermoactinomyces vulgaris]
MKMNNIQLHIYNETGSTLMENPSWDQVKKVMKQVDGINIDLIGLKVVGKGELTLMGGNEIKGRRLYAVQYSPENNSIHLVVENMRVKNIDEYEYISCQQTGIDFPQRLLVPLNTAIIAFEEFYNSGNLTDKLKWVD